MEAMVSIPLNSPNELAIWDGTSLLLVWHTGLYILWEIVVPIHIKPVYSSGSYQWAIYQKYNWRGHDSPRGYMYGP